MSRHPSCRSPGAGDRRHTDQDTAAFPALGGNGEDIQTPAAKNGEGREGKKGKKKERVKMPPREKACDPVAEQLLKDGKSEELEREFVGAVYDRIAKHFSHTRYKPWPKVRAFLEDLPRYSLVVDVGCGNGKYLQCVPCGQGEDASQCSSSQSLPSTESSSHRSSASPESSSPPHPSDASSSSPALSSLPRGTPADPGECLLMGVDISRPLLECAQEKAHARGRLAVATCLNTNIRAGIADAVISIAVAHHLASEERRLRAIEELRRIARPGGLILITVWAERQEEGSIGAREFRGKDVFVPWHLQKALETRKPESEANERRQPGPVLTASKSNGPALPTCGLAEESLAHAATSSPEKVTRERMDVRGDKGHGEIAGTAPPGDGVTGCCDRGEKKEGRSRQREDKGNDEAVTTVLRYYHVFSREELLSLCARVPGIEVVECYFDSNNWGVILRKL